MPRRPRRSAAERFTAFMGSRRFIVALSVALVAHVTWNSIPGLPHYDPAPFFLLNLSLSFWAAYTASFVIAAQGQQEARDRAHEDRDHALAAKAEREIREVARAILAMGDQQAQARAELAAVRRLLAAASARKREKEEPHP